MAGEDITLGELMRGLVLWGAAARIILFSPSKDRKREELFKPKQETV